MEIKSVVLRRKSVLQKLATSGNQRACLLGVISCFYRPDVLLLGDLSLSCSPVISSLAHQKQSTAQSFHNCSFHKRLNGRPLSALETLEQTGGLSSPCITSSLDFSNQVLLPSFLGCGKLFVIYFINY
ncbi:hypothetical protein CEXT_34241 [Caerostris extrusa]|uniref:Uncharacterized protein n=1 Tax=Caerostris extrusa TaxID=172846 RepID=A0AAV4PGP7_CAEEX|nr:hypothetical protein CEXT_34241 [Caerostris extrusa]